MIRSLRNIPRHEFYDALVIGVFDGQVSYGPTQELFLQRYPEFKRVLTRAIRCGEISENYPVRGSDGTRMIYAITVAKSGKSQADISKIHASLTYLRGVMHSDKASRVLIYPLDNDKQHDEYWYVYSAIARIFRGKNEFDVDAVLPKYIGKCPFGVEEKADVKTKYVRAWMSKDFDKKKALRDFLQGKRKDVSDAYIARNNRFRDDLA